MVCLRSSEGEIEKLMDCGFDFAAFFDPDLPLMNWTAVAFRPCTRDTGKKVFGHLSLA